VLKLLRVLWTTVHAKCGRDSGRRIEGRKIIGEGSNVKDLFVCAEVLGSKRSVLR
jgi:hypothetical protein